MSIFVLRLAINLPYSIGEILESMRHLREKLCILSKKGKNYFAFFDFYIYMLFDGLSKALGHVLGLCLKVKTSKGSYEYFLKESVDSNTEIDIYWV